MVVDLVTWKIMTNSIFEPADSERRVLLGNGINVEMVWTLQNATTHKNIVGPLCFDFPEYRHTCLFSDFKSLHVSNKWEDILSCHSLSPDTLLSRVYAIFAIAVSLVALKNRLWISKAQQHISDMVVKVRPHKTFKTIISVFNTYTTVPSTFIHLAEQRIVVLLSEVLLPTWRNNTGLFRSGSILSIRNYRELKITPNH